MQSRAIPHPLIRILSLLVLAAALPVLALPVLVALLLLLLALLSRLPGGWQRWMQGLWRLKWLFLALFVLYVGYTPGEPLWPALPGLSAEGLHEGSRRALVLGVLLAAVQGLMAVTPTPQLVEAMRQLLRPLRVIGIDGNRFALRLALVLSAVGDLQKRLAVVRANTANLLDAAGAAVADIERASSSPAPPLASAGLAAPRLVEFLLPLAFAALLWVMSR